MVKAVMHPLATALIGSCALLVVGCQTVDSEQSQAQSRTKTGAVIGAVSGAALGILTSNKDDRAKGAVIGATVGAGIGGGIGYVLDRQEEELRRDVSESGLTVDRSNDQISVVVPEAVGFDSGSSALKPEAFEPMKALALSLTNHPNSQVKIAGHTDSAGDYSANLRLSIARAKAVAASLEGFGVSPGRIHVLGLGSDYPIAENTTNEGRAKNRRVEVDIIPNATSGV